MCVAKIDLAEGAALGRRADAAAALDIGVAVEGLAVDGKGVDGAVEGGGHVDAGLEGVDLVLAGASGVGAGAEEDLDG